MKPIGLHSVQLWIGYSVYYDTLVVAFTRKEKRLWEQADNHYCYVWMEPIYKRKFLLNDQDDDIYYISCNLLLKKTPLKY